MRRPPRRLRCASSPVAVLAGVCGAMEGASEGELHEPLARQAAEPCRKAGAGPEAIPRWIAEGRKRRSCGRYTVSGGCASVPSWKSPQDEIYPVQGT